MRTANELLTNYQHHLLRLTLETGTAGIFDVEVNGELIYSKAATGRHANPGEVLELFRQGPGRGLTTYER